MLPDDTRDRQIIADPTLWPLRPRLPMKRFGEGEGPPDTGYLVVGGGPVIHDYDTSQPKLTFDSLDAMLDAGWRVD